jgi:hypothetical protein
MCVVHDAATWQLGNWICHIQPTMRTHIREYGRAATMGTMAHPAQCELIWHVSLTDPHPRPLGLVVYTHAVQATARKFSHQSASQESSLSMALLPMKKRGVKTQPLKLQQVLQ